MTIRHTYNSKEEHYEKVQESNGRRYGLHDGSDPYGRLCIRIFIHIFQYSSILF